MMLCADQAFMAEIDIDKVLKAFRNIKDVVVVDLDFYLISICS